MVGLAMAPIPSGARLLALPGETDAGVETARRGRQPDGASEYGCLVSTLGDGTGAAYDYDAVYTRFPNAIVEAAGGRVRTMTVVLRSAAGPEWAGTAVRGVEDDGGAVVRVARCRLPDTPEAVRLVKEGLRRFRESSWAGTVERAGSARAAGGGETARTSGGCLLYDQVWSCVRSQPGSCFLLSEECLVWDTVRTDPWGGGGSGPGTGGSSPDPCENTDGTATSQLCVGGPDGGAGVDPEDKDLYCKNGGRSPAIMSLLQRSGSGLRDMYNASRSAGLEMAAFGVPSLVNPGSFDILPVRSYGYQCGCEASPNLPLSLRDELPESDQIFLMHTHPFGDGEGVYIRSDRISYSRGRGRYLKESPHIDGYVGRYGSIRNRFMSLRSEAVVVDGEGVVTYDSKSCSRCVSW